MTMKKKDAVKWGRSCGLVGWGSGCFYCRECGLRSLLRRDPNDEQHLLDRDGEKKMGYIKPQGRGS